ncbi:MAG: MFS transporter [Clostridiaceae bacterium]|jgi:fucose permease|nr:MFS transporter [Clostridiaceae bacterium]
MVRFFILIIYLAFISLGLPDSLLGAAWPVIRIDLGASLEAAGIISMIITFGTIISSLLSEKLIKRFGTGKVTFVSVLATAAALLGFSVSSSFAWLILFAVPLGLGAGSVDAGLNNFVALHYKAHHMSWLHCFWGIGATLGPVIISRGIKLNNDWRSGYLTISIIQAFLVVILFFSIPVWNKISANTNLQTTYTHGDESNGFSVFRIKGLKLSLTAFLFYCGVESTTGLWGSSYLVNIKNLSPADAARWISVYYAGITIGRLIVGFITMKFNSRTLIRGGQAIVLTGVVLLLLPLPVPISLAGFVLIGLGCAPIFPSMLHETPNRFGKDNSQKIMGLQMAFAYIGSAFLPPVTGFIAAKTTIMTMPFLLLSFTLIMLVTTELINWILIKNKPVL